MFIRNLDKSVQRNLKNSTGGRFPSKRKLEGDTEIWVGLRKSIVGQMVRSFFDGGSLYTLKPVKMF
jgi:hypothetical protein